MNTADSLTSGSLQALAHGVLASLPPALFILAAASVLSDILPGIPFAAPPFLAALFAAAAAAPALTALFRGERGGRIAGTRAMFLSLLAMYALHAAFAPGPWALRLLPSAGLLASAGAFALQWFLSERIFSFLFDREALITDVGSRGGESMYHAAREDGSLMIDAARGLAEARGILTGLAAGLVFLLILPLAAGGEPSARTLLLGGAFFAASEFEKALFRLYREEFSLAALGLREAFSHAARNVLPVLFVFVLALSAAAFFPSGRVLIPMGWLFSLLARLSARFAQGQYGPGPEEFMYTEGYESPGEGFRELLEEQPILFDPTALLAALKVIVLTALLAGALAFLFGPFFERSFREFFTKGKARLYLKAFTDTLLTAARGMKLSFFRSLREGFGFRRRGAAEKRERGKTARAFGQRMETRKEGVKSPEKRREIGELTDRFMDIMDLGERLEEPWKANEGPLEYALRLGRRIESMGCRAAESAGGAGRLFEKGLYARETLSAAERAAYFEAVRWVLEAGNGAVKEASDVPGTPTRPQS